jgi:hypothetical protein
MVMMYGWLISLWLYKGSNRLQDFIKIYLLYILPPELHTRDFVVLSPVTHPRKIPLVAL